jgi:uncharacterized protein (DUF1697 family)
VVDHVWIALLRGINLGSRNRVPMAGLRQAFEEAGCESVATYIQSGNVVFVKKASDRGALARKLEQAVRDGFDVSAAVVLRTSGELAKVVRSHPFGRDTSHSVVTCLAEKPGRAAVRRLEALDIAPDRFEVVGSDVFLHYPNGFQGARLTGALLERHLEVAGTARNWRTVARLTELAKERTNPHN